MEKGHIIKNQKGFTLVEIIAVLIILGILAAVAVPRYIDLEANAKLRAIDAAISELNGRESLAWADTKISVSGWAADGTVWTKMKQGSPGDYPYLGTDYSWGATLPTAVGGSLSFKAGTTVALTRTASTGTQPGKWSKSP